MQCNFKEQIWKGKIVYWGIFLLKDYSMWERLQIHDKITKLCQNVNSLIRDKNFEGDTPGNDYNAEIGTFLSMIFFSSTLSKLYIKRKETLYWFNLEKRLCFQDLYFLRCAVLNHCYLRHYFSKGPTSKAEVKTSRYNKQIMFIIASNEYI